MDSHLPAAGRIINTCSPGEEHRSDSFRYCIANTESLSFEEEEGLGGEGEGEEVEPRQHFQIPSLDDKMPFTQMLRSVESPSPFLPSFIEYQSFQVLLRLQHQIQRAWDQSHTHYSYLPPETSSRIKHGVVEPESCLTHDILDESPVRSETKNPHPSVFQEQPSFPTAAVQSSLAAVSAPLMKNVTDKEKRKRKRTTTTTSPAEGKEVESQRMIHIAVERNRRRQMNDHLSSLRSLMPPSYVQRGDQASIIGGAIDLVKELEQLLETLQAQKRKRNNLKVLAQEEYRSVNKMGGCSKVEEEVEGGERSDTNNRNSNSGCGELMKVERKSGAAKVQVTVIQKHVNLKIEYYGRRARGSAQIVRAIVALEKLKLTVLHLNITSLDTSLLYSFSLQIEEDCKVVSAEEIAGAVHQIFTFINGY